VDDTLDIGALRITLMKGIERTVATTSSQSSWIRLSSASRYDLDVAARVKRKVLTPSILDSTQVSCIQAQTHEQGRHERQHAHDRDRGVMSIDRHLGGVNRRRSEDVCTCTRWPQIIGSRFSSLSSLQRSPREWSLVRTRMERGEDERRRTGAASSGSSPAKIAGSSRGGPCFIIVWVHNLINPSLLSTSSLDNPQREVSPNVAGLPCEIKARIV
jgi:hypothetical protein